MQQEAHERPSVSDLELQQKLKETKEAKQNEKLRVNQAECRNRELEAELQSTKAEAAKCLQEKDILIQDLQRQLAEQQEETKLSCRCSKRKYENILSKLYPHIGYLYFHDLSPFQATTLNKVEIILPRELYYNFNFDIYLNYFF